MIKLLLVAILACGALFGANNKITVAVSIIPQKYFIERIAGDLVNVVVMVQKGKSPEIYEPTMESLKDLSKASLYFNIGMPFEGAWMARFKSVNPSMKIIAPLKNGELESYLLKYGDSHDSHKDSHESHESQKSSANHSHDSSDFHANHAPHIWMSFVLSKAHATQIAESLCEIDSAHCAEFRANLATFLNEIDSAFLHFQNVFKNAQKPFIVYHPAFSYLANELNLREIAIEKDGKEGKIAHTREILDIIKKHNIKVIFTQPQFSTKIAQTLANEANITLKTADPLAQDWLNNLRDFLHEVAKN